MVKFVLVLFAAGLVSVVIAQPPAKRTRDADDTVALRVRQALADDPTLSPHKLSLLVNVLDGVVVIGGPVPDDTLTAKIEAVAKAVDGAARVKVSVWPLSPARADPLAARLDEKMNPRPKEAPAPAVTLSVPTDTAPKPDPRPTAGVAGRTQSPPNLLQPPVQSVERTSRAPHARPPGAEPPEYTPIPATNLPTEPVLEPPTPRAATPTTREPEPTTADAWKRDPRFAGLNVDVRSGTATISGRAKGHTAAWELAEVIRGWPTVERVVVGRVDVGR